MSKLKDEVRRLQITVRSLENDVRRLNVIADCVTECVVCPICGSKMIITVTNPNTYRWYHSMGVKLECPKDHFTTSGKTLSECLVSLERVKVERNEQS